jgi:hypothetical protein
MCLEQGRFRRKGPFRPRVWVVDVGQGGKLFSTPEVVRVYAGSFWNKDLVYSDEKWLLDELLHLPSVGAERKVNSAMVKNVFV